MPKDLVGELLKRARNTIGLTQVELAQRVGVSNRLLAELERGERPNVSLTTALRLMAEVGVKVQLTEPSGASVELGDAETLARARAHVRRAHWTGRQLTLSDEGSDDPASTRAANRVAAVGVVSQQAFSLARAKELPPLRGSARAPSARSR